MTATLASIKARISIGRLLSIGQVCNLIGHPKTIELQMIPAADHCLNHAYNDGANQ